jgi:hypothetical protein
MNVADSILVRLEGRITVFSWLLCANAPFPILIELLLAKVTTVKLVHDQNALVPTLVTLLEIVTVLRLLQKTNAFSPITVDPLWGTAMMLVADMQAP